MDVCMYEGALCIYPSNDFERSVLEDMFDSGCDVVISRDCQNRVIKLNLCRKTAEDSGTLQR